MKKLVAASVGVLVMSAGLVASTGTAAQADPYPGTVATTTTAVSAAKVKRNRTANVCGKVTVTSGTGTPVGTLTITVTRKSGGFSQSDSFNYAGGTVCLRTKKLKKLGKYVGEVAFTAKAGTVFKSSSDSTRFKVVKPSR